MDITNSKTKYIKKTKNGEISYLRSRDELSLGPGETFYLVLGISWPYNFTEHEFQTGEWYFKSTRHYTLDFVQETK